MNEKIEFTEEEKLMLSYALRNLSNAADMAEKIEGLGLCFNSNMVFELSEKLGIDY